PWVRGAPVAPKPRLDRGLHRRQPRDHPSGGGFFAGAPAGRCYTRRAPGSVSKTAARGAFSMRNLAPLALLTLVVVLVLTACGGGGGTGSLGSSDVIVVGGQHVSKDDLNTMMERAKKSYEANKQKFPKPGTQEYIALQGQALTYLLQRAELAQRAKQL